MPILLLIVFVDLLGFGIIIPLAPYYAEHFGAAPDVVTLLMATFSVAQFIAAPFWGRLSDRIGRKPVLAASVLGTAAAYLWMAFATDLWMLFAARAASGFMSGNIAAAMAYVADVTRPEQRSRGMGLIGAAFGLGFIFGPIVGGLLGGPSASEADFRTPFLVAAGLSSVAVVMTLTLLRESWTADKRAAAFRGLTPAGRLAELGRALHLPVLGLLIVLFFIFTFVFAGMESTYALWAERRLDWGPRQVGTAFGVAGLLAALIQGGAIGPLTRLMGEANLVLLGSLVLGFGLFAVTQTETPAGAYTAMGLMAAGISLASPALSALISRNSPSEMQGSVLGISQSASSLARVLGPAWAGFIFVGLGPDGPYLSGALIMVPAFMLAFLASRRLRAG